MGADTNRSETWKELGLVQPVGRLLRRPVVTSAAARTSVGFDAATSEGRRMTEEEFDAFYHASFARLVGQIYAMCGNVAEAQDCVQEAFVRAWDKRAASIVIRLRKPGSGTSRTGWR